MAGWDLARNRMNAVLFPQHVSAMSLMFGVLHGVLVGVSYLLICWVGVGNRGSYEHALFYFLH